MEDNIVNEILLIVAKMDETQLSQFIHSVKALLQAEGTSFSVLE